MWKGDVSGYRGAEEVGEVRGWQRKLQGEGEVRKSRRDKVQGLERYKVRQGWRGEVVVVWRREGNNK